MRGDAYRLMADLDEDHWWYRARRGIVCDIVGRFVPSGAEVVDYGCGTGATAARLRQADYRVVGADVSGEMVSACRRRGLPAVDLGEEALPPAIADCVLACDVLEHVEDDADLLRSLRRLLRPGGLLVGTVPAYEFLWSGEDFVSGHFRRYTRRSVCRLVASSGYGVVWSSYFNTLLFPVAASVILAKRLFRPRDMYRSNIRPAPAWQNALLQGIFEKERGLLRWSRLPFGLSVAFVARAGDGPG
jgi:SAM-dependent methyltransferase